MKAKEGTDLLIKEGRNIDQLDIRTLSKRGLAGWHLRPHLPARKTLAVFDWYEERQFSMFVNEPGDGSECVDRGDAVNDEGYGPPSCFDYIVGQCGRRVLEIVGCSEPTEIVVMALGGSGENFGVAC